MVKENVNTMIVDDLKSWLKKGIEYLESREEALEDREDDYGATEFIRICGKKDGLKVCLQHIEESEKIYGDSN
jgi:hypothetical protein